MHVLVQNRDVAPDVAWSYTLDELILAVTPLADDSNSSGDDGISFFFQVQKVKDRLAIMERLTMEDKLELEQYKYRYC